jgi:Fe2+ or Zn2+ uptake regulation protein
MQIHSQEREMTESKAGFRVTRQRTVVLEELRKFTVHPTAEEIFRAVRKRLPRISLGTVYRNLEVLFDLGEVNKLEFGGSVIKFDADPGNHYHIRCEVCDNADPGNHYHIRCEVCDRVDNVPFPQLTDVEDRVCRETEYRVIGHRLEFYGLCPECARHMISPGLKKLMEPSASTD